MVKRINLKIKRVQREIFHDPAEQSTLLMPSVDQDMNQSNIQDRGLRSLIDLSPIQPQREVPTLLPTLVGGVERSQRGLSDGFPKTVLTMAALKGTRRLYVQDQTGFRIGRIVIIHRGTDCGVWIVIDRLGSHRLSNRIYCH